MAHLFAMRGCYYCHYFQQVDTIQHHKMKPYEVKKSVRTLKMRIC